MEINLMSCLTVRYIGSTVADKKAVQWVVKLHRGPIGASYCP